MWAHWSKVVERVADQHRTIATTVSNEIVRELTHVRNDDVAQQLAKASLGKKVIRDLKNEELRTIAVCVCTSG